MYWYCSGRVLVAAFLLICIVQTPGTAIPYDGPIPLPTRWMSPDGLPRPIHEVPIYEDGLDVFTVKQPAAPTAPASAPNGRILVVVSKSIYNGMSQTITEFTWDLAAYGYSTQVLVYVSGGAESLRSTIANYYAQPEGLEGAIFIGNIPYIIYEMMEDWGGGPGYTDFVCDFFFMDLDGTWADIKTDGSVQPGNGKYDTRSGNLDLEIWVSRIKTDNLPSLGNESTLISTYLSKNHGFRAQTTGTNLRAVVYDDDDWSYMAPADADYLAGVFGGSAVAMYNDPEVTTAADFMDNRLPVSTRWYMLRSHGWPGGHGFVRDSGQYFETVTCADYRTLDPPGAFFSLFVCSGCDFSTSDNLGATIAFNPQSPGLLSFGSTKTGGMWMDNYFYSPMSQGQCIGESFRMWFNQVQYYDFAPPWWYGMVLIGDASLHPNPSNPPAYHCLNLSQTPATGGTVTPALGTHTYPAGIPISLSAVPAAGYTFECWLGNVADPLAKNTTITLGADEDVTAVFSPITADQVKLLGDSTLITLVEKAITYAEDNIFYIEEDDRYSGIRVNMDLHGKTPGMRVSITGRVYTDDLTDERFILASSITPAGEGSIPPLGMNNKAVGGGDWNYDAIAKTGQRGVVWGYGLNNIGLLVKTWGRVQSVDIEERSFIISDGSLSPDPVTIKVLAHPNANLPGDGEYVVVTGISSCYKAQGSDDVLPLIKMIPPDE